jgi:hypothetical protein
VAQAPNDWKAEEAYLRATAQESYEQMAQARQRVLELVHYHKHRLTYRKRTEIAIEIVRQWEEGQFPQAPDAFDNGVVTLELTRLIERRGNHWVSEINYHPRSGWFEDAPLKGAETRDGPLGATLANLPSVVSGLTSP